MLNTIREAQKQFQLLHQLLNSPLNRDTEYFTQLSIESEEAYVLMNAGMCVNTSVCRECAEHRDFIRSILDILSELEINASAANTYAAKLTEYSERVNKILKNIAVVLAS